MGLVCLGCMSSALPMQVLLAFLCMERQMLSFHRSCTVRPSQPKVPFRYLSWGHRKAHLQEERMRPKDWGKRRKMRNREREITNIIFMWTVNPWIQLDLKPASFLDILNTTSTFLLFSCLTQLLFVTNRVLSNKGKNKCLLPFFSSPITHTPTGSLGISLSYTAAKKLSSVLKRVKGLSGHLGVAKQCIPYWKNGVGGLAGGGWWWWPLWQLSIPDKIKDTLEGNLENERFHSVSPYRV